MWWNLQIQRENSDGPDRPEGKGQADDGQVSGTNDIFFLKHLEAKKRKQTNKKPKSFTATIILSLVFNGDKENSQGQGQSSRSVTRSPGVISTLDNFLLLLSDLVETQTSGLLGLLTEPGVGSSSLHFFTHQAGP